MITSCWTSIATPRSPRYDGQIPGSLVALSPLRNELMRGDLRPAYLAWLLAVQAGDVEGDAKEPPVPAGLEESTAAKQKWSISRIDIDLVAAAARASAAATEDSVPFRRWLLALSAKGKDAWLRRAAGEPDLALGGELLRAFRATAKQERSGIRRSVDELRALAESQAAEREKAEVARANKAKAAAEAERQRRLTKLGCDVDAAWSKLEKLVEASGYDEAVALAIDLRDLADREKKTAVFAKRFETLRKRQLRRRGFFDRWKRANEADLGER